MKNPVRMAATIGAVFAAAAIGFGCAHDRPAVDKVSQTTETTTVPPKTVETTASTTTTTDTVASTPAPSRSYDVAENTSRVEQERPAKVDRN